MNERYKNMAILKPENMDFSDKNIIMIISGMPGVGKTTLALSAPDVVLIDADEGMARVKKEHRKDSSVCKTYEEVLTDIKAMEGKYKTVVIDTAGALLDMMKDWATRTDPKASKASGGFSLQGFGIIKQEFLRLSAELRKKFNVIYLFHESMDKNNEEIFFNLVCEGSARTLVWQPADLGAHMFIQNGRRYLGFTPTSQYSAKSAYGIKGIVEIPELKEKDKNVFLTNLFAQVRKNLADDAKINEPNKEAYDLVMKNGVEIISKIEKPDDVSKAGNSIAKLNHVLTSETELRSAFKTKLAELGIVYDSTKKAYRYETK